MAEAAHLTSLDAVRDFRGALKRYEQTVRDTLDGLGVEVQKAVTWVGQDRAQYWPGQTRKAEERIASARTDLELCKAAALKNESRSCVQEQKMLENAVARLRHCETQVRNVKRWQHTVDQQTEDFQGRVARLVHYLDVDIPRALAALDRMIRALEKYAEERRPRPGHES